MKREVKAALVLALALGIGLLAFWLSGGETPAPQASPRADPQTLAPSRALAQVPAPSAERSAAPTAAKPAPTSVASPSPAAAARPQPTSDPSQATPPTQARLEGIVIAPDGSPVATKVYVFEVGPRVNPLYSDFGRSTPPEVAGLARRLSQDRGNLLAVTTSDKAGRFRFERQELNRFEVVLAGAAAEGVGALRVQPGLPNPVLTLEARRLLQVQVLSQEDLAEARLELDLGPAGALEFPALDARGATRLELPAQLPAQTHLRLQRFGWLPLTLTPAPRDLAGGRVTWTLPTNLVELRGEVQDPAGDPWANQDVMFMFQAEGGEDWRHLLVTTDTKGAFLGRGFPPGQRVLVRIIGGPHHAYHQVSVEAGGPPLAIQLQEPSLLRIRVERFAGDVDALETEWKLERREGESWSEVDATLFGRPARGFADPDATQSLKRRFGLRVGSNEIRGLPPGRYRVSLAEFVDSQAEPVEVELPPQGSATCELGVQAKPETTFRILLASPGAELAGKQVRITYSEGAAEILRTPTLDARGALTLPVKFTQPLEAEISVPGLGLGAKVTLDPKTPDLGTVVLQRD